MTSRPRPYLLLLFLFAAFNFVQLKAENDKKLQQYILKSNNEGEYKSDELIRYARKAATIATESGDTAKMIEAYENFSSVLDNQHYYQSALEYSYKTADLYLNQGRKKEAAGTFSSISLLYDHLGKYPEALKASHKCLELYTNVKDTSGVAYAYNDIGVIHYYQSEFDLAKEYYSRALKLFNKIDDVYGVAMCYNNIANIYADKKMYQKALDLYFKAYKVDVKRHDKAGQSITLGNIGDTYTVMQKYAKAEDFLNRSLKLADQLENPWLALSPLMALGRMYKAQHKYPEGIEIVKKAIGYADSINSPAELKDGYGLLTDLYKGTGQTSKALETYEKYVETKDSLFNLNNTRAISDMEVKYQVKDKSRKIELLEKEKEIDRLTHEREISDQKSRNNLLMAGLGIILLFSGVIYWGLLTKRKANKKLAGQKLLLQEKNKEITDSITYAQHIQNAILPSEESLENHLLDFFILYKPKDIVAGDFYWLETAGSFTFFAVADCTGHGVPGAMVSVVCSNALNQSVHEYGLRDPGSILDKTRELVVKRFEKSTGEVKDGMDISLVAFQKGKKELKWAGANNPLWIMRDKELLEFKATKQAIGLADHPLPYKSHDLKIEKNDVIYLFSDGYADQFGGEKNKKFKIKNLKKLICSVQDSPLNKQEQILQSTFETWKNDFEQVDDVCIAGVKLC